MSNILQLSDELGEYKVDEREMENVIGDIKEYDDVLGVVHNSHEGTVSLIINMTEFEPEIDLKYIQ